MRRVAKGAPIVSALSLPVFAFSRPLFFSFRLLSRFLGCLFRAFLAAPLDVSLHSSQVAISGCHFVSPEYRGASVCEEFG